MGIQREKAQKLYFLICLLLLISLFSLSLSEFCVSGSLFVVISALSFRCFRGVSPVGINPNKASERTEPSRRL